MKKSQSHQVEKQDVPVSPSDFVTQQAQAIAEQEHMMDRTP